MGISEKGKTNIQLAELFCGAGGMALGAHLAQHSRYRCCHLWATDNDKNSCLTFQRNFPEAKVLCEDISQVNLKAMPKIHGLLFGFPCNDFSQVGEKRGAKGKYGGLYRYCIKALQETKPLFFVAENVGGLKSSNQSRDYQLILEELSQCGYRVSPKEYRFEQFSVPQRRHRIIIVGIRQEANIEFQHALPSGRRITTVEEALKNIPPNAHNHEKTAQSSTVVERLKHIAPGQNAFSAEMPENLRLNVRNAKLSMIYRRLKPDEPSYTITGSGGGGTHVYHWKENRALTNRERARLQTFPDSFHFIGGKESVRRQIGMAVPPEGIRIVFQKIMEEIEKHNLIENPIF